MEATLLGLSRNISSAPTAPFSGTRLSVCFVVCGLQRVHTSTHEDVPPPGPDLEVSKVPCLGSR